MKGYTLRALLMLALSAAWAGCDDSGPVDAGADADRDGSVDADSDADGPDAAYPLLDCGDDDQNMLSCMMAQPPDPEERDGVMCGGECRPACFPVHVCPDGWVCHVAGVMGVCFEGE